MDILRRWLRQHQTNKLRKIEHTLIGVSGHLAMVILRSYGITAPESAKLRAKLEHQRNTLRAKRDALKEKING